MANQFLPICMSLSERRCLVVGGGHVALRKIDTLLNYEVDITVIAPEVDDKIDYYASKNSLKLIKREYKSPEATEYGLVISASDNMEVNHQVAEDSRKAAVPVNVVDKPSLCDFIFPAVIRRDCLSVAVSSDGKAPFLSGHIRLILENIFPANWEKVAKMAAEFRRKVQARWKGDPDKKAASYGKFLNADWKTILKEKKGDDLEIMLDEMLDG
jgi:uroporphyrin-III C-methyltransferase/precorrin-2 dehydrogenase/sirohydrochlorin ferrochelatase